MGISSTARDRGVQASCFLSSAPRCVGCQELSWERTGRAVCGSSLCAPEVTLTVLGKEDSGAQVHFLTAQPWAGPGSRQVSGRICPRPELYLVRHNQPRLREILSKDVTTLGTKWRRKEAAGSWVSTVSHRSVLCH